MPPVHDYVLDNATGANFRSDLNNALAAIVSNNSSSTEPSTKYAYQWWADTNEGVLKIRNSSNDGWVTLLQLDGTLTLEDGSASAPALGFRDDLNTGIFSSAADNLDITTGGTTRVNVSSTGINVTGTVVDDGATHDGDVTFTGASANVTFDKSSNELLFADNAKASFGNNGDLVIKHDGSNSIIQDNGTGELQLQRGSNTILTLDANGVSITDPDGAAQVNITGFEGGGAKVVLTADEGDDNGDTWELQSHATSQNLNFRNDSTGSSTVKWNLTTDGDVTQTGHLDLPDSKQIKIGTGDDLLIYHDSSNQNVIESVSSGEFKIKTNTNINITKASSEDIAFFKPDSACELYFDNSKKFETLTDGVKVSGQEFISEGTIILQKPTAHHHRILSNDTGNDLSFQQSSDTGSNTNFTTYLRIEDGGNIALPNDSQRLRIGAGADLQLYHFNNESWIKNDTGTLNILNDGTTQIKNNADNETLAQFVSDGKCQLRFDNSTKLETTSSGIDVTGAITVNGSALSTGGGKILQVIEARKTDTFSSTSSSFVDVTGLSATITPSASTSKILVMTFVNFAHSSENRINARVVVVESGTESTIGQAHPAGNRVRSQFIGRHPALNGASMAVPINILHTSTSTNALTYKFQFSMIDGGTGQINFGQNDSDSSSHARGLSTLIVMEVAA